MTTKFASLCVLAYKRPDMLAECLKSLHETIDYPCEIIINFDGGSDMPIGNLGGFSKVVNVQGQNRGVGRSFQNCIGVAEGEYIFKIDTDLIFQPKWLSSCIQILDENTDVGAVSAFNYQHYNPQDTRFQITDERELCFIVNDFVSSIYGFRKDDLSPWRDSAIPDDGLHSNLARLAYYGRTHLAITKTDLVTNQGFGLGKSVYVVPDERGNPIKAKTYDKPLLFGI